MFCRCFDENIYIFELFGLTLICKELALSACRLTVGYPVLTHISYQLGFQCVRLPRKRGPDCSYRVMDYDPAVRVYISAWLTDGSWMSVLAGQEAEYNTKPGPSLEQNLCNDSFHLYFTCSSVLPHIYETMCDFFFIQYCLSLILITRCARSEYTVSTLRLFLR